jgi:hypothetical protein
MQPLTQPCVVVLESGHEYEIDLNEESQALGNGHWCSQVGPTLYAGRWWSGLGNRVNGGFANRTVQRFDQVGIRLEGEGTD